MTTLLVLALAFLGVVSLVGSVGASSTIEGRRASMVLGVLLLVAAAAGAAWVRWHGGA